MRAMLFPGDEAEHQIIELPDEEQARNAAVKDIINGWLQGVPIHGFPGLMAYMDEEGKLNGKTANALATRFMAGRLALADDYIVGPMVLMRYDAEGADAGLTDEDLRALAEVVV